MFKNSVFNPNVDTKLWCINACIRAVKTFAQTMLGFVVAGLAIAEINWELAISVSTVSMLASILTSIGGIPEVEAK